MRPKRIFVSYSHKDEALCEELLNHLSSYESRGLITTWRDRAIDAGDEWKKVIEQHLENDDIILLLISSSFLASKFCRQSELRPALKRHQERTATVIPIILRACSWQDEEFANLNALPKDGLAVTSARNTDEAFKEIAEGILRVITSNPQMTHS